MLLSASDCFLTVFCYRMYWMTGRMTVHRQDATDVTLNDELGLICTVICHRQRTLMPLSTSLSTSSGRQQYVTGAVATLNATIADNEIPFKRLGAVLSTNRSKWVARIPDGKTLYNSRTINSRWLVVDRVIAVNSCRA